jgi:hypothetical protein
MAKKTAKMEVPTQPAPLTEKAVKAIEGVRAQFTSYVQGFVALQVSRQDLAPKFMRAFGVYQSETAGTFPNFVRQFDPTIGPSRDDYRNHKTFQAADYLRRITTGTTASSKPATADPSAPPAATPLDAAALAIATVLSSVPQSEHDALWRAVSAALHWSERQVANLRHRAEAAEPVASLEARRGTIHLVQTAA